MIAPTPAPTSPKPKPEPTPKKSPQAPRAAAAAPPPPAPPQKSAAPAITLPAILFEGDGPTAAPEAPASPTQRFDTGPISPTPPAPPAPPADARELPESYGTGRLLLAPRDPFWLFAHWDFSFEHLRRFNSRSVDGHLILRVYRNSVSGQPVNEIHLHPESREWFVNVPHADAAYVADLGYHASPGHWHSVTQSPVVQTPAAVMSTDLSVQFAAVPIEIALQEVIAAVEESTSRSEAATTSTPSPAPTESFRELRELPPTFAPIDSTSGAIAMPAPFVAPAQSLAASPPAANSFAPTAPAQFSAPQENPRPAAAPSATPAPAPTWTSAQARTFAAILELVEQVGRSVGGSEELLARVRQQLSAEISSNSSATNQPSAPASGARETISSAELTPERPTENPAEKQRGFWFNVNAELVIYGATEPTAQVTIGGRPIKLRADGTFGYRFALPDGNFELPVVAIARDHSDGRAAKLSFTRATEYRGDVAAHPQDPALKPPLVEHVS